MLLHGKPGRLVPTKLDMSDIAYDILLDTGINVSPLPVWLDEWSIRDVPNPARWQNISRGDSPVMTPTVDDEGAYRLQVGLALLERQDSDGACNRAYYAMFDAARAALMATNAEIPLNIGKTHSGVLTAFSQHLVKNGPVPRDIGRLLQASGRNSALSPITAAIRSPLDDARPGRES